MRISSRLPLVLCACLFAAQGWAACPEDDPDCKKGGEAHSPRSKSHYRGGTHQSHLPGASGGIGGAAAGGAEGAVHRHRKGQSAAPGGGSGGTPTTAEPGGNDLTPVRDYLAAEQIPPTGAGAYGLVVFQYKATPANRGKLKMVCNSFVSFFPRNETSDVPLGDRMITIWPIDDPQSDGAKRDDCDHVVDHYDLNASAAAIRDARKQHAVFDGEGPYLVGWSPSNTRGVPNKLVLVIDMSHDNNQSVIDHRFLFWKNKVVQDPSLWRDGFSLDGFRTAIRDFANQYGSDLLQSIKLVSIND